MRSRLQNAQCAPGPRGRWRIDVGNSRFGGRALPPELQMPRAQIQINGERIAASPFGRDLRVAGNASPAERRSARGAAIRGRRRASAGGA